MSELYSLQAFYQQQMDRDSSSSLSTFDRAIYHLFVNRTLPSIKEWEENLEECIWQDTFLVEEKVFENWKQLLTFNLFRTFTSYPCHPLAEKVRLFEHQPWNQQSPYFRALVALNHALAQMPVPEAVPSLLENGAALIDLSAYCPWLALPYTPYHLEFGLFLSLLGLLTQRTDLQLAASQIGRWQCNTLDSKGRPFHGLFVREKEGNNLSHLCLSYLFFRALAIFNSDPIFAGASQAAMQEIQIDLLLPAKENILPLWVLIEKWLEPFSVDRETTFSLSESIYDPSMALVGYRSPSQHVVCTLHGGHTGLGTIRKGDIEIVSYGPQHFPLEDCRGFGIEGNALSDHGIRQSMIECKPHAFTLKGCTRLVDQPSSSPIGQFRGIWLEVTQAFKPSYFHLDTRFLGLENWGRLAFSFFIKAAKCQIAPHKVLWPRTLECYEGKAEDLIFEGEQGKIQLKIPSFKGTLQVVPLAGGNYFWGADFLVAYLLDPEQAHYQWQFSF